MRRFEKEGSRVLELVKPLSETERSTRVLIDRFPGIEDSSRYWSVAMAVEHLIIVGSACAQGIVLLSHGKVPPSEARIENVKPNGALKPMELESAYTGFLADYSDKLNTQVGDRKSKTTHRHPWLGPMTSAQWNWLMSTHQGLHRHQIQLILAGLDKGDRVNH